MARRARAGDPRVAVAYLRVSTEEQKLGPEAQRSTIEAWAARQDVSVASWHLDDGVSGGTKPERRPALLAALEAVRVQSAGALVVAKRDRVARDIRIALQVDDLARRAGARLISADGTGNGSDPADGFMRNMINSAAEYERELIRSRTKAALAVKKSRGERVGTCPFGYSADRQGRLVVDLDEQTIIGHVLNLRDQGLSERKVARKLRELRIVSPRSGVALSQTQVHRILRRSIETKGEPKRMRKLLSVPLKEGARGELPTVLQPPENENAEPEEDKSGVMTHPLTGQELVNRKTARRVVSKPDYLRDGAACDVGWLATQVRRLKEKGRSARTIAAALRSVGVCKGDGADLEAADVERLAKNGQQL